MAKKSEATLRRERALREAYNMLSDPNEDTSLEHVVSEITAEMMAEITDAVTKSIVKLARILSDKT